MYISINLEQTYIDKLNDTLTVEFYKNWTTKFGEYQRLLAVIPGVPAFQATAMQNALSKATFSNNVINFPTLKLVEADT